VELTAGRAAAGAVETGANVVSPATGEAGPAVDVLGGAAGLVKTALPQECGPSHDAEVEKRISKLEPLLEKAYEKLHEQAPHARIVVLGYPRFFPTKPTTSLSMGPLPLINTQDQAWMNAKIEEFDQAIAKAAAAQGVEYVDTTDALDGHELTTKEPWIFGLDRQNWHSTGPAQHDFHPTPDGQAAMAKLAEHQIEHP
jgi:lysophospholipase L1-like esterase